MTRQSRPDFSYRAVSFLTAIALVAISWTASPVVVSTAPPPPAVGRLQRDIQNTLAAPHLQSGTWAVLVKSLARDEVLYSVNAGKLLLPSSNLKILTLAAAADRLGWDFAYETHLIAAGPVANGVLDGDLIVVGSGDPSIDNWDGAATRLFAAWADQLKAAGIHTVSGRIIGDDDAFDDDGLGRGWEWDDLDRSYAASVGALQFNENTAQVTIGPGAAVGEPATITSAPDGAALVVRNLIKTGARGSAFTLASQRIPGNTTLFLRGSIALGARPVVRNVSVVNPTLYFVNELRHGLVSNGIDVKGPAVDIDDVTTPPARTPATTIASYQSPPLSALATTMMKLSQNLFAETLLKTLGKANGDPTAAGGIAAVHSTLTSWGIPESGFSQADGSGLSRYNHVTAETIVAVLTHVEHDVKLREPFRTTLPIAGRDGTLENRMKGTRAEGNAQAKTGSLTNAHALSGYVTSADGEPLVFAVLTNNPGVPIATVDHTIDAIVERLARFSRK